MTRLLPPSALLYHLLSGRHHYLFIATDTAFTLKPEYLPLIDLLESSWTAVMGWSHVSARPTPRARLAQDH